MEDFFLILKSKPERKGQSDAILDIVRGQPADLSGFDISMANNLTQLIHQYKYDIAEYIFDKGLSNFLSMGTLNEEIVQKGTPVGNIHQVLQNYLDKLSIDHELIIVDPYFYARTKTPNYDAFIETTLLKYLPAIKDLIIITGGSVDSSLKTAVETRLRSKNSSINIVHKTNNDYHDRFWISCSRQKGIVMGTSLNGLGNKLTLVDRLNTTDVRDIVQALIADGLL